MNIKMLVGTDWWTDCDDAVAMRVLAWAEKRQLIKVLGIGINACMEYSAASLDAFLHNEGLKDVPIGIDREATDYGGNPPYQKRLAELPGHFRSNDDVEDAVKLYRKILSGVDGKIDIVEIGYPQVLANLILSEADDITNKSGLELIKNKVAKLWMMAGKWDDPAGGSENNFARNNCSRVAASIVCQKWPTSITFLGWEIANTIITGSKFPENDLLHQILVDHGSSNGRASWDPMLTLMACIHDEKKAGYECVRGKAYVDENTGVNRFAELNDGPHQYVKKLFPDTYYQQIIDDIIGNNGQNTSID